MSLYVVMEYCDNDKCGERRRENTNFIGVFDTYEEARRIVELFANTCKNYCSVLNDSRFENYEIDVVDDTVSVSWRVDQGGYSRTNYCYDIAPCKVNDFSCNFLGF